MPQSSEARFFRFFRLNDVISLIRVTANLFVQEHKIRHKFLNVLTKLFLRDVGIGQPDIIDLPFHLREIRQTVLENPSNVPKAARLRDHWDLKSRGLRLSTRSGQVAGGRPSKLL